MIFLVLRILFTSLFALQVKHHYASGRNVLVVGAISYIVSALGAGIWVGYSGEFEFSEATWIIGALCGVAHFVSYFFIVKVIGNSGISITWSVVRLSVLIPVLFSIFCWKEQPNAFQIGGIVSVCISLPLLSSRPGNGGNSSISGRTISIIVGLLLATGGVDVASKAFTELSPAGQRQIYLLFVFGTTALVSTSYAVARKLPLRFADIPFGIILGICNLLSRYFLLLALAKLPGMLVFPISGSMSIVLTTLAGVTIWREKLQRLTILGIIAAMIAVILINLK